MNTPYNHQAFLTKVVLPYVVQRLFCAAELPNECWAFNHPDMTGHCKKGDFPRGSS